MELNLKSWRKSGLLIEAYLCLQLIKDKDYENLEYIIESTLMISEENFQASPIIEHLEGENYILITGDSYEEIYLTEKAKALFPEIKEEKEIEKNVNLVLYYFFMTINKWSEAKAIRSVKAESNRKFVRARLKDGYTVEELKKVIDVKKTNLDSIYFRIETLFNATKFQSYFLEAENHNSNTNNKWSKSQMLS